MSMLHTEKALSQFAASFHRRGRVAQPVGDVQRKLDGAVGRGTALPADVNQELLGLGFFDGDVLDEQPQHSLAVLGLGGGSMPYPPQVSTESQHFLLLLAIA